MAIDPTEERIAAGDTSGRILIWTAFKDKVPQLQKPRPQPATAPQASATAVSATTTQAASQRPLQESDSDSDTDSSDSEDAAGAPTQATAAAKAQESAAQDTTTAAEARDNAAQGTATAAKAHVSATQSTAAAAASNQQSTAQGQSAAVQHRSVVQSQQGMDDRFARMQNSTERVPLTTVHWHAHPVASLCFSADGRMLLSGGEEAVLVSQITGLLSFLLGVCGCGFDNYRVCQDMLANKTSRQHVLWSNCNAMFAIAAL